MAEATNNPPNEFIVKESATTNILIGLFFLALFIITLVNFIHNDKIHNDYGTKKLNYILIGTFITALIFIIKGLKHPTIITINKNGFYYFDILKTDWKNFISAEVIEEQVTGSYEDNFVLQLRFYKESEGYFVTKIPMRNTFNRSGEEVIEAIKQFAEAENKNDGSSIPNSESPEIPK